MPVIKLKHVVSCSSEDKNNPADNLLKAEGTHKWKCATAGEKSASVVIQLEKASQIHSLDIGNEGSAFVEILVGRSTAVTDQDYQVLLVASCFMTPLEARNNTNRTSVRMFDAGKLSATVVKEKWDQVKIVCTQPFNKTSTFGLSFIKFHAPPEPGENEEPKKLGFFKLKDEGGGDVKTGSIFQNRGKVDTPTTPLSGAAAVRAASRLADTPGPSTPKLTSSTSAAVKPSPSSSKTADNHSPAVKKEVKITTPSGSREKRKHNGSDDDDDVSKTPLRKQSTSLSSVASSNSSKGQPPLKKTKSEPPKDSPVREFNRLMERVVFVLSGYQNPERGDIRDRAMAMGATYKPDWGKGCTHLICAFVNTPKYNQVNGKGRIVDKKWISDCYKQKKLLPWRNYRKGDADSPVEDSDEEITPASTAVKPQKKTTPKKEESVGSPVPAIVDSEDDLYGGQTDSGEDTEDEIRRIKEGEKGEGKSPKKSPAPAVADEDLYGADTDEDEKPGGGADSDDSGLPELPDFFCDKHFLIYGKMEAPQRRLMTRYITAYGGELEDYMSDKVNFVVTAAAWDNNFDDALSDNSSLVFVKPRWVQVCHDKQKAVPHQPYSVVPPE